MPTIKNIATGQFFTVSDSQLLAIQNNPQVSALFEYSIPFIPIVQAVNNTYKVLTGLITQSGTNDPTIQIFDNTFYHAITPSRIGVGNYLFTNAFGEFTNHKTWLLCLPNNSYNIQAPFFRLDDNTVELQTYGIPATAGVDGMLTDCPFEIRVYS